MRSGIRHLDPDGKVGPSYFPESLEFLFSCCSLLPLIYYLIILISWHKGQCDLLMFLFFLNGCCTGKKKGKSQSLKCIEGFVLSVIHAAVHSLCKICFVFFFQSFVFDKKNVMSVPVMMNFIFNEFFYFFFFLMFVYIIDLMHILNIYDIYY